MIPSARSSPSASRPQVHLRIKHPRLDPDDITKALAIEPEHTLPAGRHASSECYWVAPLSLPMLEEPWSALTNEASIPNLAAMQIAGHENVVGLAMRQLQAHRAFFQRVQDDGGTSTLLITTDKPGSMTIQPALAKKLGEMGLTLELDWSGGVEADA